MNIQSANSATAGNLANPVVTPRQNSPEIAGASLSGVVQQAPPSTQESQVTRQQLDQAVKAVNDFVNTTNNSLQFSVDGETGISLVKVIDSGTKEVIRQIPSEEMLAIAKALDSLKGLLVHQKV